MQSDRAPLLGKAPPYSRRFDRQRALELVLSSSPRLPLLQEDRTFFIFFLPGGGRSPQQSTRVLARLFLWRSTNIKHFRL